MQQITSDLYNISTRLKEIDSCYALFWNEQKQRYEIHNQPTPNFQSLEFVVPYDELDFRTIRHACRTRIEHHTEIEAYVDNHNNQIIESAYNQMREQISRLGEMLEYASSKGHEVAFTKSQKWI
ncbi:MAG: hypothetical protein FWE16_01160 [Firmicutes bacterium]|nr:hypothetical protein [Bacillota bacterium]